MASLHFMREIRYCVCVTHVVKNKALNNILNANSISSMQIEPNIYKRAPISSYRELFSHSQNI